MPRFAEPARAFLVAACVWLLLATPPLRALLESTMTLHMLVQLPSLGLTGYTAGVAWRNTRTNDGIAARVVQVVQSWNVGGSTGVIAAGFVMVLWMLPRGLDVARLDLAVDGAKYLTVAAAGTAVALSWPRLPVIARGVIHLEVIATLLRFGWGYMAAEERLCLVYLAGDQQRTGELLLWVGAAYALVIVWRPLFGHARLRPPASGPAMNDAPHRTGS